MSDDTIHYRVGPHKPVLCQDDFRKHMHGKGTRIVREVTCRYCRSELRRLLPLGVPAEWDESEEPHVEPRFESASAESVS